MIKRLIFPLITFVAFNQSVQATSSFGRTAGQFGVSAVGSAQYSIPIWTPPGPRGIQPHLSLAYDSEADIGSLGIGWSIAGLGTITRCNLTYAQDAAPAPVALAVSDGYCLNGNRLRLTGGTYGTNGSTYQTEIADFSNITANGASGNGPQYFTVQGRDGLTYMYGYTDSNGNGVGSEVLATGTTTASSWLLSKVIDRAGNNLVINYTTLTGTAVPNTILWTPTSAGASTYTYTMQFNYTSNVPQSSITKYIAGTSVSNTKLLSSIEILNGTTVLKDYFLTYQASPTTGRDELITIKECADSAQSNCLLPTSVGYQNGALGVSGTATTALSTGGSFLTARYDLNGDGYPDLVYNPSGNGNWYVSFGSASGYGTPVNTGLSGTLLIGNLTGGKQDGILAPNGSTWYYYTWNGSSFTGTSTGLAYDSTAQQYQLADVNGDGLPDLISLYVTSNGSKFIATVDARLNTSTGSAVSFSSTLNTVYTNVGGAQGVSGAQLQTPDRQYGKLRRYDFNGDGMDDLALMVVTGVENDYTTTTYELLATTSGVFTPVEIVSVGFDSYEPVFYTNWNDDACTDFVVGGELFVSGCNGTVTSEYTLSGVVVAAMDWDGDGRTDLLVSNGSTIGVYLSTGAGPGTMLATSIPYNSACQYVTMDANADGLDDLGCWTGPLTYYLHNGAGQLPDLLTSIKDGYGNSTSPSYVSLAQSNYTESSGGDATFPYQDYIGPIYVVSEAVLSDPSNMPSGTYNVQYYYAGAWTNLQGRGFQSFYSMRALDSRNSLYHYQYFEREFPESGMDFEDLVSTSAGASISQSVRTPAIKTLSSATYEERYFPYFSNVTNSQWEVGGAENGDLITTTSTNYTVDNYGNATTVATSVTDNDPGSPYVNDVWSSSTVATIAPDTSTWCLNLPTEVDTTNTPPSSLGAPAITRHVSYVSPDYTNCRQTEQVIESGNSSYQVTTAYTYGDSFGNLTGQSVTGIGMAARTSSVMFGTTGQFPTSVTNALSQVSQINYDPNSGKILSAKDPNGIQTSWTYDAFQRKNLETRPDGTSTTWSYNNCSTAGCVNSNNQMTVTKTVVNVGGTTQSVKNTYLDSVNRPLVTSSTMLNGAFDRNETQYNSLGLVKQQGAPCTFVSCTNYWTTFSYDVLNRMTQSQRPISQTNGTLQTTTYGYQGRTSTVTDPYSKVTTKITKVTGNVGRTKDNNGYYINFNHDAFGSVLSVTDSLSNTLRSMTYAYGVKAFRLTLSDMDSGTRSYTPDALGEVTAYSDGKGQDFSATFDALSRMTSRTEPDLTSTWTWGTSASSDNIGKLASISSTASAGTYSETYTYDSVGRSSSTTYSLPGGGGPYTFNYTYSTTTGLPLALQYPLSYSNGYRVEIGYCFQNGILAELYNAWNNYSGPDCPTTAVTLFWAANATNPRGQITEENSGNTANDVQPRIVSERSYDAVTGWLNSIQAGVGSGSGLQNQNFLYDEMGDVTQRQDSNAGLTENFYYDNLYRLDHSILGSTLNLQMSYDAMGDITSRSDVAGGATWTYDPTHKQQVTQAGNSSYTYTYDANGNAITRNGTSIGWTSYNYPEGVGTSTESATFDYGPNRQRWRMIYSGPSGIETTYYASPLFEVVVAGSTTTYRHNIYAGGRPVMVIGRGTNGTVTVSSLLTDHQQSLSNIVQNSASVVQESFTPYGNRREASTWSGPPTSAELTAMNGVTREGYTFQTVLGSMGLNHMNGRVEDAVTGRFLSPDSLTPNPGNTQSWNRYSYVTNNPLTFTDPTGHANRGFPVVHCKSDYCNTGSPYLGLSSEFNNWAQNSVLDMEAMQDAFAAANGTASSNGDTNSDSYDDPNLQEIVPSVTTKLNPDGTTQTSPAQSQTSTQNAAVVPTSNVVADALQEIVVEGSRDAAVAFATTGVFVLGVLFPSNLGDGVVQAEQKPPSKSRQSKPKNAPPGTRPIDQSPNGHEWIEGTKGGVGAGPADWVGVAPNGDIITTNPDGTAENHGPSTEPY